MKVGLFIGAKVEFAEDVVKNPFASTRSSVAAAVIKTVFESVNDSDEICIAEPAKLDTVRFAISSARVGGAE